MLSALDGWLNLDIALDELPTGTRDELCVQAFTQALEDIEKLHAQVRARLSVQQIQGLLDAAILTARELGQGHLDRAKQAALAQQSMEDSERALLAENESLKATVEDLQQQNLVITAAMQAKDEGVIAMAPRNRRR